MSAFAKEAKVIAATFDAVMDVYGFAAVEGADGITVEERVLLYAAVPCALSGNCAAALGGDMVGTVDRLKVFCAAEYEVPVGCELEINCGGRVYRLEQCGMPRVYAAHQELLCVVRS